jgi:penicillin-insensitive murein endopeptidase
MRTLALLLLLSGVAEAARPTWSDAKDPSKGRPASIGSYANGCLRGGVALPLDGPGHTVMRRLRRRFFGHPDLAEFLKRFSEAVHGAGLERRYVGDVSQPRGGPMPTGHSSHQIGLDMDIFFGQPKAGRPLDSLVEADFPGMVDEEAEKITGEWKAEYVSLLQMAAAQPGVERIFVNYVIKKHLCDTVEGDRAWLGKVRPWWAHTHHFHVRLSCPKGDRDCKPQAPLGAGDGCGDERWFTKAAVQARIKAGEVPPPKTHPTKRKLPAECGDVLTAAPALPPPARPDAPAANPASKAPDAPVAQPAGSPPAPAPPPPGE